MAPKLCAFCRKNYRRFGHHPNCPMQKERDAKQVSLVEDEGLPTWEQPEQVETVTRLDNGFRMDQPQSTIKDRKFPEYHRVTIEVLRDMFAPLFSTLPPAAREDIDLIRVNVQGSQHSYTLTMWETDGK